MLVEKSGWITKQNSKLIIKIFPKKYYIPVNGINEALNGQPFGLDIKNCEGKSVGVFNISKVAVFTAWGDRGCSHPVMELKTI